MLRRAAASGLRALKRRIPRAWRERAKAVLRRGPAPSYVERRAPELDQIVPRDAKIEQLASGFGFTEGPVWLPEGHLLFADLPQNVIRKWDPRHGASVVRTRSCEPPVKICTQLSRTASNPVRRGPCGWTQTMSSVSAQTAIIDAMLARSKAS